MRLTKVFWRDFGESRNPLNDGISLFECMDRPNRHTTNTSWSRNSLGFTIGPLPISPGNHFWWRHDRSFDCVTLVLSPTGVDVNTIGVDDRRIVILFESNKLFFIFSIVLRDGVLDLLRKYRIDFDGSTMKVLRCSRCRKNPNPKFRNLWTFRKDSFCLCLFGYNVSDVLYQSIILWFVGIRSSGRSFVLEYLFDLFQGPWLGPFCL